MCNLSDPRVGDSGGRAGPRANARAGAAGEGVDSIDTRTGGLLGRYIAEERNSARLLRSCHECLRATRAGDDGAEQDRIAGLEAKVDALGRSVDELRRIVRDSSVATNST